MSEMQDYIIECDYVKSFLTVRCITNLEFVKQDMDTIIYQLHNMSFDIKSINLEVLEIPNKSGKSSECIAVKTSSSFSSRFSAEMPLILMDSAMVLANIIKS